MPKLTTSALQLRPGGPADAADICAVHCSNVSAWRSWTPDGSRPARYADLSAYQRWLNGGPWLDPETCAWHLQRLLDGGGLVLAAELRGRVLAAAELHPADEPPYGRHLNLSTLYVHHNHQGQGLGSALVDRALALAAEQDCDSFLVAHAEAGDFYRQHGLKPAGRWVECRVLARPSPVPGRYTRRSLVDGPYERVAGWALTVGRRQNARHDWERTRPGATPAFPEWRGLRLERFSLTHESQRAVVIFEESPSEPGLAETFIFTPKPALDLDLFEHVRGRAALSGFVTLQCLVPAGLRLPGAVKTGYTQQVFQRRLKPSRGFG